MLSVLEVRRDGDRAWQLPWVFVAAREPLDAAVLRCLRQRAGVAGQAPRQLHVFGHDRDEQGWVLSVAHVDVAALGRLADRHASTRLAGADAPGRLPYAHGEIVARAVEDVRTRYAAAPDPDQLLGDTFTLRELRLTHEAVAGEELPRDTFRRLMDPQLAATGETRVGTRGRPAELFTRA